MHPYLLVNTDYEGVVVPDQYIRDSRIVLNLAPDAIDGLNMDNDWVSFSARFSGKAMNLFIPVIAIQAIYGKENNEGMFFPEEEHPTPRRQQLKNLVNQPIKQLTASQA